jgi:hypothetical protein
VARAAHDAAGTSQPRIPLPAITGPIPVTAGSRAFVLQGIDLEPYGYMFEEYFVSGHANVYDWGEAGESPTPRVRTADAPYTTRLLLRRPADPEAFSGNVWVELTNPTHRYDVEHEWATQHEKLMRDGDVHVGLTVKPVSIAALQRFDGERYAALSMANPLRPDEQPSGRLPGEPGYDENRSKLFENGLVWDIVSQVGAVLRVGQGGPLGCCAVERVFATGMSQTGMYLNTYAASFAQDATLPDGRPVYDGFVAICAAGRLSPINQSVPATAPDDPRSALPPGHVPLMRVDSQSDVFTLGGYATRRPDADGDDPFRLYEIAGSAHGWSDMYNYQPPRADILAAGGKPISFGTCTDAKWNGLPRQYIEPAMLRNMERWVADGTPPPRQAEPLRVVGAGTPEQRFETDRFGNALGGVRNPWVDVPIATYSDHATDTDRADVGAMFGHQVPFTTHQIESLYGSRAEYVAKVRASVEQLVRDRWLEPADGEHITRQAQYATIP